MYISTVTFICKHVTNMHFLAGNNVFFYCKHTFRVVRDVTFYLKGSEMEDDFRKTLRNYCGQENSPKLVEREI